MNKKRLQELLDYNKNTGEFRWKIKKSRNIKIGDIAGYINELRYRKIMIDEKFYLAHRLAWLYVYGKFPKNEIDHINHKRDDNRINNLRDVTHLENHKNTSIQKSNTSGISGVHWYKLVGRWAASIKVNGEFKHLGHFKNIKDAKRARDKAKAKYGYHLNHA